MRSSGLRCRRHCEDPTPGSLNATPLTHRYRLLAQAPEPFPGGEMRIASEVEFPISTTMTGALLTIAPAACANCIGIPTRRSGDTG